MRFRIFMAIIMTLTICYGKSGGAIKSKSFEVEPKKGKIVLEIIGIEESGGDIYCSLYDSPEGFPKKHENAYSNKKIRVEKLDSVYITFEDIPYGNFAISFYYDENLNGKMDYNIVGIPKEGYGFSNNIVPKLAPPSFEETSFEFDSDSLSILIDIVY